MKTRFFVFLPFLFVGITSFAQTDIILHDTIFYYSFNNPEDSILVGMHCKLSDSADRVISKLIYEEGETMEEGGKDSVNITPMVKVWREYDSTGNLILELIDHMDRETASFEKWQKSEWKYDEYGRILQYSKYSYLNNEVSSFSSHRKEYQYDSAGNILIDIYSKLYGENQAEYKKKVESGYDSLGNLILKKEFEWYGLWSIKSKTIYSYNEENVLIKTERSTSTQKNITDFFYDGLNRIRTRMELRTDYENSEIKPYAKNEYFYTATGDTVKMIRYHYKDDTEDWHPVVREDNIYDSLNRITYEAEYIWDNQKNRWKGLSSFERSFNEKDDIIYDKTCQWNDDPGQWEQNRFNHYTFHDYGSLKISSTYTWKDEDEDFVISGRTFTKLDYYQTVIKDSICAGETYHWQEENIQESGTYKKNYISITGRDSILSLDLYVYEFPDMPEFIIDGVPEITQMDTSVYSITEAEGIIYEWRVENGTILSQPQDNMIEVQWGDSLRGSIICFLENEKGCRLDTAEFEVLLIPSGYENLNAHTYSAYPNPADAVLSIISPDDLTYVIINLQGVQIMETGEENINIERLPPGPYFLIFKDGQGKIIHREQFIKSN